MFLLLLLEAWAGEGGWKASVVQHGSLQGCRDGDVMWVHVVAWGGVVKQAMACGSFCGLS